MVYGLDVLSPVNGSFATVAGGIASADLIQRREIRTTRFRRPLHSGSNTGCVVVKQCARIKHTFAFIQERVASAYERGAPLAIRVEFHTLIARREQYGA